MTLIQVRCALAVARLLSFTRASAECALTQSSLSHAVGQLEAELGLKLFVRTTRRVIITPEGAQLLSAMAQILETSQAVERLAERLRPSLNSAVRLGVSPVVDAGKVAGLVESFETAQPSSSTVLLR